MTKEEFINNGYNVIDCNDNYENSKLAEFLKNNYPSIYRDGEINLEELKNELNIPVNHKTNGYGLNFIGRNLAVARYRNITDKELKINYKLSKDFNNTKNIVIKGDNIDALKILNKYYRSKIKCIYIDPPYNTDSDNFLYPDRFDREELEILGLQQISEEDYSRMEFIFKESKKSHNAWLTFMYPRLKLAKDLLTDDGVIFISIDDNEYANLKLLCDEIFGEDNFIGNIIWLKKNAQNDAIGLQRNYENILCYCKKILGIENNKSLKDMKVFEENNNFYYEGAGLTIGSEGGTLNARPNLGYTIYYNPDTKDFLAFDDVNKELARKSNEENKVYTDNKELLNKGYIIIRPPKKKNLLGAWTWKIDKFNSSKNSILIKENNGGFSVLKKILIENNEEILYNKKNNEYFIKKNVEIPYKNIIDLVSSSLGTKEIGDIFNSRVFQNPKPSKLIKLLINMTAKNNDIILDFFAGSGTTGQAVMELNAEDGGNRKFILCQKYESINENKASAFNFCKENKLEPEIFSITIERLNRAGKKIKEELKKDIDIGYKVFDLQDNNKINLDENKKASLIFNDVIDLSRIYNMIISVGLDEPTSKLEIIIENCAYCISSENKKRYYITNSPILLEDKNKIKFSKMIENGDVYIDGWTVNSNVSLQQYKDNVKIIL